MGAALVIDLASRHPAAGALITESGFTSIVDAASGTLFAYMPLRLIVTERFAPPPARARRGPREGL